MDYNRRLVEIEKKLEEMRNRYATGSSPLRLWLIQGAQLLKNEKTKILKKIEKEKEKKETIKLFDKTVNL